MGLLSRTVDNTTKPQDKLAESITKFSSVYASFSCILFEVPRNTDDNAIFCKKVNVMIDKMGTVIPLPNGRPLVMLPLSQDRELIAHRLSKTLNAEILLSFPADSSETVIKTIDTLSIE